MRWLKVIAALVAVSLMATAHGDESNPLAQLAWQVGPNQGVIGDKATIKIPQGFVFLGAQDTKKFMELNRNLADDNEYLFAPRDLSWFAVFDFNPVGYVKDNESLNADDLLASSKKGTEAANEERRKRGWPTLSIQGWRFPPQYDRQTKLLEWALMAKDDASGEDVVNYNTRLLGRTGVMQVVLVSDPARLDASVQSLKTALTGYEYVPGERYAEYKEGDRVAEFGLAALVAGGAAAVAAKKGLFAAVGAFLIAAWKFLLAAAVGILAWVRSLFRKKAG